MGVGGHLHILTALISGKIASLPIKYEAVCVCVCVCVGGGGKCQCKTGLVNLFEGACQHCLSFDEILWRSHGNFENQNKVLEFYTIIIYYCTIIIVTIIIISSSSISAYYN